MSTGALFTIGIAVLLIVVVAVRRRHEAAGEEMGCDGKHNKQQMGEFSIAIARR